MRLPTALLLLVCIAPAARAADQPIPQDPEKDRQRLAQTLAWNRATLAGAYDKVGNKEPRWDKAAHEAMEAAATFFSDLSDADAKMARIYAGANQAVQAGCNDPLVLYLYSRSSYPPNYPGDAEFLRHVLAAAAAMEKSAYPAQRRAVACYKAGQALSGKDRTPEQRRESMRLFEAALALMAEMAKADEAEPARFKQEYDMGEQIIQGLNTLLASHKAAFDKADAALAKTPALKVTRLKLKGTFLMNYAWEARGEGFANTVTEEGWKKFGERLSEAREALEQAWEAHPGDVEAATTMVNVLKGLGGERDEMEKWFERAMKADGSNYFACSYKLDWLNPKWHGTQEDLLAFGRACRDTKNWKARLPLLLADAHYRLAQHAPKGQAGKYFTAEVWKEINSVYEEYLKRFPSDMAYRSRYAVFCALCQRYVESDRQFKMVGDKLTGSGDMSLDWVKQVRTYTDAAVKAKVPVPAEKDPK